MEAKRRLEKREVVMIWLRNSDSFIIQVTNLNYSFLYAVSLDSGSINNRVLAPHAVGTGAVRMSGGDACVVLAHR